MPVQREVVGEGAIDSLRDVLCERAPSQIALVTGRSSYERSGAAALVEPHLHGFAHERFGEIDANPTLEQVAACVAFFRRARPDIVLAVGGGSVIDTAKAAAALAAQEGDVRGFVEGAPLERSGVPLIAVPTTSGSGSEATHFAVVYVEGVKHSLADPRMLPECAIVDPQFTYSAPTSLVATTGADALSQGIEAHWSIHSTEASRAYSAEAISLSHDYLARAVAGEREARERMSRAAHLAGKAINIAKTTASHAMSYALTIGFGVPHGQAVIVTLPQLVIFNAGLSEDDVADPRGVAHVRRMLSEIAGYLGASDAAGACSALESLMRESQLATRLGELGVRGADIEGLVEHMSLARAGNNPRRFTPEAARTLLHAIL